MLSKTFILLATLVVAATASPTFGRQSFGRGRNSGFGQGSSFNDFGGSLSNFDNFYGGDNFSGFHNQQTVIEQSEQVVCHSVEIEVIQQRLAVIQEFAKRIVTQQVCEVETQVVAFQQFISGCNDFQFDLHRRSGRQIGFDSGIASHFGSLVGSDGSLTNDNLGFSGSDLGSQFVPVGGSNWDDSTSPQSVGAAFNVAQSAAAESSAPGDVASVPVDSESVPPADDSAPPADNSAPPADAAAALPPPPPQASTCAGCSD